MMKLLLLTILTFFISLSSAQANQVTELENFPHHRNWLLIGVEAGLIWKGGVEAPEVDNNGFGFGFKGIYSRYYDNLAWDFGFGWRSDSMENNNVSVKTKAFYLEVAGRYRFNEFLSAGPMITGLMGQDVSYSDVGTNSDDRSLSTFIGGRLVYEQPIRDGKNLIRYGVQVQTDIDLNERQVTMVQGYVEFGWPFWYKTGPMPKPEPKPEPEPVKERPKLKLNLMNAGVRFATGKSELVGRSNQIIEGIARVLAKYKTEWSNLSILGHTDAAGDYRANIQLSLARAEAVANIFEKYKTSRNRMTVAGYGPERPLDPANTPEAYARNRRVEIQITATNPSEAFVKEIRAAVRGKKPAK